MALCLGMVDFSAVSPAGWFQLAAPLQDPSFPTWVHTVFGSSPIVVTAMGAILLNLTFPKNTAAKS